MKKDINLTVSVVVCTVGESESIFKCLNSILSNSVKPKELIVVHQNYKYFNIKQKINLKKFAEVKFKYIYDDKFGLSRARNIGYKNASSEIISYTDDDAYVGKDWIKNIINTFKKYKNVGIAGGKIIPVFNERNKKWHMPKQCEYVYPSFDQGRKIGKYLNGALPPGVNYSIIRSILIKVAGYNEKLGYNLKKLIQITGEDSDITLKAMKLGYKIIYNPNIVVYHPVPLERQSLAFLKSRLNTEGLTDGYLYLVHNKLSFKEKFFLLKYKLGELISLFKQRKKYNSSTFEGIKARIIGYIIAIIFFGWNKNA
jgi:GT2 family glycosyltransferase